MRALLFALLLMTGTTPAPRDAPADPDLLAGIAMVREGDFEAAVVRLDAAVRRLEAQPARKAELARAFLYLGVGYLELEQELLARGKFRECLLRDREITLSPREFSPQVIRVFEAERQALGDAAPPPPPQAGQVKAAPPEPATKRSGGRGVWLVIGGGAAAAGTALLVAGGGGESQASTTTVPPPPTSGATSTTTTTTTTSSTVTTSTTTSTTSSTEPPSCQFELSPPSQSFPATGGTGSCQVRASRGGCGWQAESTESWIQLTGATSGSGDGSVPFLVVANTGSGRTGRIRLREDREAGCEIRQGGVLLGTGPGQAPGIVWISRLDVPGGRGQVTLNGSEATFHEAGLSRGAAVRPLVENRLEAVLVTAGRPGVWRFELGGRVRPGSLRVIAGRVALLTDTAVAFLLEGHAGERVVLAIRAD